jgi:hypothetical protein
MIMGILKIYISRGRKITSVRKKYGVRKIGMPDIRNLLRAQLQEGIASMWNMDTIDIEDRWKNIKTLLNNICENLLGFINRRKKDWISSSTWEKIEERRRMKAELCAGHSFNTRRQCELQEKYKSLNKDVKVNARRDHREFLDSLGQ